MSDKFPEEDGYEDVGDVLRYMRENDPAGGTGSDDCCGESFGEGLGHDLDDESGYLPDVREGSVGCHIGNPTRKGLSYIIYSTASETMAERLISLLSRFVLPCSIVEVHSDDFYTFGCWLREDEINEISEALPMYDTTHIDWDEQMRKLLSEEENDDR